MNEDEARIIRVYQYLLSKDVYLKQKVIDREKRANRKNVRAEDVFSLWVALVKLEFWEEIASEVWQIVK